MERDVTAIKDIGGILLIMLVSVPLQYQAFYYRIQPVLDACSLLMQNLMVLLLKISVVVQAAIFSLRKLEVKVKEPVNVL